MKELICRAIQQKHLLAVLYHGHERLVAPHVYGVDRSGEELLSCYQVSGGAVGGESSGWKSFHMSELSIVRMLAAHFSTRPEFQTNDPSMVKIYCQVKS